MGSTVITGPGPARAVTQPSTSRPFTRRPQVPQEAWKQECRRRERPIAMDLYPAERLEDRGARPTGTSSWTSKCDVSSPRANRNTRSRRTSVPDAAVARSSVVLNARSSCVEGRVGEQDRLAGPAGGLDPELAADDVRAELGHAAEGRGLAPGDRDEPLDAVLCAWSIVLNVRDSSRPLSASCEPINGRAADHAARNSAVATAGMSSAPSSYIRWTWSSGTSSSSGSSTVHDDVPTIDNARCGTTMSPSPERCMRLMTMLQRRPRSASITPGEGWIGTLTSAIRATFSDHGPVAFTTRSARSSPSRPVTRSWTATPPTTPCSTTRPCTSSVFEDLGPVGLRGREEAQGHPHRIHGRVGDAHRRLHRRVQQRLQLQRLVRPQLLGRDAALLAAGDEVVVVRHVLVGDRHEQPVVLLEGSRGRSAGGSCSPRCIPRRSPGRSRRSARPSGAGRGAARSYPRSRCRARRA